MLVVQSELAPNLKPMIDRQHDYVASPLGSTTNLLGQETVVVNPISPGFYRGVIDVLIEYDVQPAQDV